MAGNDGALGDDGPVVAADASPVVAYEGETRSYDGPTLLDEGEVGSDNDPAGLPMANGMIWIQSNIEPGATSVEAWLSWQLRPGTYLLDCSIGDPRERMWRVAQLEVVAAP